MKIQKKPRTFIDGVHITSYDSINFQLYYHNFIRYKNCQYLEEVIDKSTIVINPQDTNYFAKTAPTLKGWLPTQRATEDSFSIYKGVSLFEGNKKMFFVGSGLNQGKIHHCLFAYNEASTYALQSYMEMGEKEKPKVKCTRLDIQKTLPTFIPIHIEKEPEAIKEHVQQLYIEAETEQRNYEAKRGHKARQVTKISSSEAFNTLYVGSRESARYFRIYQIFNSQIGWHTRLEVELKEEYAFESFKEITEKQNKQKIINELFYKHIFNLKTNYPLIEAHLAQAAEDVQLAPPEISPPIQIDDTNVQSTLTWFKKSFSRSAKRLLLDPSTRKETIAYIKELQVELAPYLEE